MTSIVNGSKEQTAQALADAHYRLDRGLMRVIRVRADDALESSPDEPIKLLEVNSATPRDGVVPVFFGADPDHGVVHPSVIVEIAPEEYDDLQAGRLALPDGWRIAEEIPRS